MGPFTPNAVVVVLSRAAAAAVGSRKGAAEPGRLMLASVKRSCPCAPAYCKDATVFQKISRSTATVQNVSLGASRSLSMPRAKKLDNGVPIGANGAKLLGVAVAVPDGSVIGPTPGVPVTSVGMAKSALVWKNGETA